MTSDDEFSGPTIDSSRWQCENGHPNPSSQFLSSRWPENVVLSGGICHLVNKKQERAEGKPFTSANIWSRFTQQYGYFEARMRYASASGVNNAFWLRSVPGREPNFEIDINEGHYAHSINMTLHDWTGGVDKGNGQEKLVGDDLSRDFHVYAVNWSADEIVWYFDGHELRRTANTIAQGPAQILLSTMVLNWAGPVSDAIDNTSMDVDWVRVYKQR